MPSSNKKDLIRPGALTFPPPPVPNAWLVE